MSHRIAAALGAGERSTLRGKNLRLGSILMQRADVRDAPALREVEMQMARRDMPTAGALTPFKQAPAIAAATLTPLTLRDRSGS